MITASIRLGTSRDDERALMIRKIPAAMKTYVRR